MHTSLDLFYLVLGFVQVKLKPNGAADHSTETGFAGPAAADLSFDEHAAIGVSHRNASASVIALVAGIKRARKPGRRCARTGVRNTDCLHWRKRELLWVGVQSFYNIRDNLFLYHSKYISKYK